jgi:hypothetical protein
MKTAQTTAAAVVVFALASCGRPESSAPAPTPQPVATTEEKAVADQALFAKVDRWKRLRSQAITCDQSLQRDLAKWKRDNGTWSEQNGTWTVKNLKQMPDQDRCLDAHGVKENALAELASLHATLSKQGKAHGWGYYLGPDEQ